MLSISQISELYDEKHRLEMRLQEIDGIILSELEESKKIQLLSFDIKDHTIQWIDGKLTLSKFRFHIVQILWNSKKHRIKTFKLCQKVWNNSMVKTETLKRMLRRINEQLILNGCPFEIQPVKSQKTHEIAGYALKKNQITSKTDRKMAKTDTVVFALSPSKNNKCV
jgi:DNA-binding response OmpR family regulator